MKANAATSQMSSGTCRSKAFLLISRLQSKYSVLFTPCHGRLNPLSARRRLARIVARLSKVSIRRILTPALLSNMIYHCNDRSMLLQIKHLLQGEEDINIAVEGSKFCLSLYHSLPFSSLIIPATPFRAQISRYFNTAFSYYHEGRLHNQERPGWHHLQVCRTFPQFARLHATSEEEDACPCPGDRASRTRLLRPRRRFSVCVKVKKDTPYFSETSEPKFDGLVNDDLYCIESGACYGTFHSR